jgi:hypothetical protein
LLRATGDADDEVIAEDNGCSSCAEAIRGSAAIINATAAHRLSLAALLIAGTSTSHWHFAA